MDTDQPSAFRPRGVWAVLCLRTEPGRVSLVYRDSRDPDGVGTAAEARGGRSTPATISAPRALARALGAGKIDYPIDLPARISELVSALPAARAARRGTDSAPVPLAVFVDAPALDDVGWSALEPVLQAALFGPDPARKSLIRLGRRTWARPPRFRPPLRLLAIGDAARELFQPLNAASWARAKPMSLLGLSIERVSLANAPGALAAAPYEIVVTAEPLGAIVELISGGRRGHTPGVRLLMRFDLGGRKRQPSPARSSVELPAEIRSLLQVDLSRAEGRAKRAGGFVAQLVESLIHDAPLHEAVQTAISGARISPLAWLLTSDPASNEPLGASTTFLELIREAELWRQRELEHKREREIERERQRELDDRRKRRGLPAPARKAERLGRPFGSGDGGVVARAPKRAPWFPPRLGLLPAPRNIAWPGPIETGRSGPRRGPDRAPPSGIDLDGSRRGRPTGDRIGDRKTIGRVGARTRRRTVVARLERAGGQRRHGSDASRAPVVERTSTLRRSGKYDLVVSVGLPSSGNLVDGEPPSLDSLLPALRDEPGHTLDAVVYGLDFVVRGRTLQQLFLPRVGQSDELRFPLTAPDRVGPARLRLCLYHRNHLLQSFLLQGLVDDAEVARRDKVVGMRLEMSRTRVFTNLDELPDRLVSIATNADPAGDHTFMVKLGGESAAVHLPESALKETLEDWRAALHEATYDEKERPRFKTRPYAGASGTAAAAGAPDVAAEASFRRFVARFAHIGRRIGHDLFNQEPALESVLNHIAGTAREVIQIVRHDPAYVLPWAAIYDYDLPVEIAGAPPPEICLGGVGGGPPIGGKTCGHGPDDKVYCIYGFWGVRHQIEVLLPSADGQKQDALRDVVWKGAGGGIGLAVGDGGEHPPGAVSAGLKLELGDTIVPVNDADKLLDLLWQPAARPAEMIVMAHLETTDRAGEPLQPRIVLVPGRSWLLDEAITALRRKHRKSWAQPNTVVLLLACGSGAVEMRRLTNFVIAFLRSGAAAVVGTETKVFAALVTRFALEVSVDLWKGRRSLGEALRIFRERLLLEGNPLGFVFTLFGDANLVVHREGAS